ncbi:MAG TPA: SRPBCC family protein [Dehalococcoidia bacterium]|nr:SRPBCC family protein [Dehalococcoidia bacterium]
MAHLEVSVFIRAEPQRVWDVIADLPGQASWMVDVRRLEIVGEQRGGAGTMIGVTSTLFGLPLVHDEMLITTWVPPERYDVEHRGQFTGTGAFVLEPAPGGTVFRWIEDFKPPLGILGEIGFKLVVGPHMRSVFGRSLANLRRLAEQGGNYVPAGPAEVD